MNNVRKFQVKVNGNMYEVEVEEQTERLLIKEDEKTVTSKSIQSAQSDKLSAEVSSKKATNVHGGDTKLQVSSSNNSLNVKAPMPGTILKLKVKVGDAVQKGQVVVILEAMKMENELVAPSDGRIVSIFKNENEMVNAGDVILSMDYDLQKVKGGMGLWQK